MIIIYLLFFITFLIGYVVGYINGKAKDIIEVVDQTGKIIKTKIKQITTPTIPTGVIRPPSAHDLYLRNLPKVKKEGLNAMKETLDTIPELQEAKRRLEEYNKSMKRGEIK